MAIRARRYIEELASRGRHHFTAGEALAALATGPSAARAQLRRLKEQSLIAEPVRGFLVIVPPEYRHLGCLPAEQFVPQLMAIAAEPYYLALLSAAQRHGAAHQRPQAVQVMVRKNREPIECGEVRVQFVARHDLERTPVVELNTPRGRLRVSSPEATAVELVGYADQCGGLDNVASVLSELVESLNAPKLLNAARLCPVVWSQRLGYLLEMTNHTELASVLADHVRTQGATLAPLVRAKPMTGAPRAERWKLAVNASVESDV